MLSKQLGLTVSLQAHRHSRVNYANTPKKPLYPLHGTIVFKIATKSH